MFCNFIEKKTPIQMFPCEFCEIFKNIFFNRTSPVAASVCTNKYVCMYVCMYVCTNKYINNHEYRYIARFMKFTLLIIFPL